MQAIESVNFDFSGILFGFSYPFMAGLDPENTFPYVVHSTLAQLKALFRFNFLFIHFSPSLMASALYTTLIRSLLLVSMLILDILLPESIMNIRCFDK